MELSINSISKSYYNGVKALSNVTLHLTNGMFGLLGPNGAGKSSLIRTLATLQDVDEGSVFLDGIDVLAEKQKIRQILGYLPQDFNVYPNISAEQMLDHIALLKGLTNNSTRKTAINDMLENVNLTKDKKKKLGTFSGGMKQRFGIAQALIGSPKLIIVDEPTAGLDPEERNRFYNLLSHMGENTILILSTHIVEDINTLCSQFAIIFEGKVLHSGDPEEIVKKLNGNVYTKKIERDELSKYENEYEVISTQLKSGKLFIRTFCTADPGYSFQSSPTSLEDVYFQKIQAIKKLNSRNIE